MEEESRSRAAPSPRRRVLGEGLLGFAFGYMILHAVAMEAVRWLEPGAVAGASGSPPTLTTLFQAMTGVFRPEMAPMGLIFGVLAGVLAGANGAYRLALGAQRDLLARQLHATERYRAELQQALERVRAQNLRLAQLEQARRHTTRFMVHDFKTHLGCIIGFSERLLGAPDDSRLPEERDALSHIHLQGRRMLNAVTDLLDLERLRDAGELSRRAVAPSDLLHDAAEDLALSVERGNVALGSVHGDCPPVLGDPRLLVRVLANLAVNAVKHNPPGTRAVLDAALGAGEGAVVVFSCRDNGRGIPTALLDTIFDEFRTEGADRVRGSSGLGLAFCKAAVEAHGGRIWCETTEGQGASFYFTVPTAEDPSEARLERPEEGPSHGRAAGAPDSVGRAGRILTAVPDRRAQKGELGMSQKTAEKACVLVVEDDADFAALVGSVLRAEGYGVATAANGEVAMSAVRGLQPDLITLDIRMPRETGILFYRHLKSEASFRDIPVIIVSGLFEHDPAKRSFVSRFFETEQLPPPEGYLEKPLDTTRLVETVAAALQPAPAD